MDDLKTEQYIARGAYGEDLRRRAICLEGTSPPADGTRWVKDPAPASASFSADALAALKTRGWITAQK
jgi:hypothetical protein